MKTSTLAVVLAMSCLVSLPSLAQTYTPKVGLWEVKSVKQVTDGKDMTAQMNAAQEKMKQAMANMSPEMRAKMEAMTGGMMSGSNGTVKICMSAAMAAKKEPVLGKNDQCPPAKISHSGNQTMFEMSCTRDGHTMNGKGVSTITGDQINTVMDMTTSSDKGQHTIHSETAMVYLGPDCQGIVPADQLVKNLKDAQH